MSMSLRYAMLVVKLFVLLCVSSGTMMSVRLTTCTPSMLKTPCSLSTSQTSPRTNASPGQSVHVFFSFLFSAFSYFIFPKVSNCPPCPPCPLAEWKPRSHQQPDKEFALHSYQEWQEGQSHRWDLSLSFSLSLALWSAKPGLKPPLFHLFLTVAWLQ